MGLFASMYQEANDPLLRRLCQLVMTDEAFLPRVTQAAGRMRQGLESLVASHPQIFEEVRGAGLMLGLKMRVPNTEFVAHGYAQHLLTVPAADNVVRLLPQLTITDDESPGTIQFD